jgi:hypothetical protein
MFKNSSMNLPPRLLLALLLGFVLLPWNFAIAQRGEYGPVGAPLVRVRVVNQFRGPVNVYQLDRWNGWQWVGGVTGESEASFRAVPRQMLVVTNARGEVLNQTPVGFEGTTVVLGNEREREPAGLRGGFQEAEAARLVFKNKTDSKVIIVRVDRAGREERVRELSGGKEWEVKSELGQEWFVTNKKGKTVERFVARGDQKVTIRD